MQQNKYFPNKPVSTQEAHRGSGHNSRGATFPLPPLKKRVHFPASLGEDSGIAITSQEESLSTGKSRGTPRVMPPFQKTPNCFSPHQGKLITLSCLDCHTKYRLTPQWHVLQTCGKASRDSHRFLSQLDLSLTLLLQLRRKADVHLYN